MTATLAEVAQVAAAVAISGGAFYWGGQVKAMLCALKNGQQDHEHRLRSLEAEGQ
jgi:hypothetical protein